MTTGINMHISNRWISLFTLVILSGLSGCQSDEATETAVEPIAVVTSSIDWQTTEEWQVLGQVLPAQHLKLSFEVSGKLLERQVSRGDQVEAQQLLAEIDPHDLHLTRNAIKANLTQLQADYRLAKIAFERTQALVNQHMISQEALDQTQTKLSSLAAQIDRQHNELELAERRINYAQLKAPKAGLINQIFIEPGQQLQIGQSALEFISHERIVLVHIPTAKRALLTDSVTLTTPEATYSLTFSEAEPLANPQTGLWSVRFNIEPTPSQSSPKPLLDLGEYYQVMFKRQLNTARQVIPASAIIDQGSGPHVWLITNQRTHLTPIQLIELTNDKAIITPQFNDQDLIVAQGTHRLENNQLVHIINN